MMQSSRCAGWLVHVQATTAAQNRRRGRSLCLPNTLAMPQTGRVTTLGWFLDYMYLRLAMEIFDLAAYTNVLS